MIGVAEIMMWVIRAGQGAKYFEKFNEKKRVYIPWSGYHMDLRNYDTREQFRTLVAKEKNTNNRTSISNWYGQLFSFVKEMSVGDYVMIPSNRSQEYTLATISGNYEYDPAEKDGLYHSRAVMIVRENIPRSIFSQSVAYTLGTFRTIFKVKCEQEILLAVSQKFDR